MKIRLLLGALTALSCCPLAPGQTRLTPDEALQALVAGNERFAAGNSERPPLGEGVRRSLRGGQSPFAVVVTCADSRVPPEHLFNAGLGELVVVRVSGQVCDPESLAGIEHAVAQLGAPLCVVMAHSDCAAIAALATGDEFGGQHHDGAHGQSGRGRSSPALGRVLERLEPAVKRAHREGHEGADLLHHAEIENAHETVAQCLRRSTTLRELVRLRRLRLVAAHYDIGSGVVEWLPERPVTAQEQHQAATPAAAAPTPPAMPPHVALSMLQAGHRRFLSGAAEATRPTLSDVHRHRLEHGQRPFAAVLTCTDSRVAPEHLFDAGLGELYVVRVAGNVVSDEALASLEHAFGTLGCGLLLVVGHQGCDVVHTAVEAPHDPRHSAAMRELLLRLEPSVARARRDHQGGRHTGSTPVVERAIELNTVRAVAQIRSRSALARQLEDQGSLGMVAVSYQLESGDLRWLAEPASDGNANAHVHGDGDVSGGGDGSGHGSDAHEVHGADTSEVAGVVFDAPGEQGHAMAAPPGGAAGHEPGGHGDGSGHDADGHGGHEAEADGERGHGDEDGRGADEQGHEAEEQENEQAHSRSLLSTILIGFMVATSGVGMLILLQRRRAG